MKKVNIKWAGMFVFLFFATIYFDGYKDTLLLNIKNVLMWPPLFYGITIFVFLTVIINKLKYNELTVSSFTDQKRIKETISDLLSLITEPSAFICSLSILKGLYLDNFFQGTYFSSFTDSERIFILIASSFFFINSFIELKKDFMEIVLNTESVESKAD